MKLNEIHFESIDSTNTFARENAGTLPVPSLITAREQTAGRGRHGKSFYSPKDTGIYFTLLFEPESGFDLITPAAAVCVCEAVQELTGKTAEIKWVNDIFYGGAKVAGILCEKINSGGLIAAGIGINLTTSDFPAGIPSAGSLGAVTDGISLARRIAEKLLAVSENYDREEIIRGYSRRLFILGRKVRYEKNGVLREGTASGINADCNLIVSLEDGIDILNSGEISLILS